jgi:hypothetical protein
MISATALLFIAAQAGFLDGPRVLATMAQDRWFPSRFATLSDRFVTQNGILLMGTAALSVLLVAEGSVGWLVVLYSMNVFLTFSLSQLSMCVHWHRQRREGNRWIAGFAVNGVGLVVTASILVALCSIKFLEGGWVTILATSAVVASAVLIHRHYSRVSGALRSLDTIVDTLDGDGRSVQIPKPPPGRGRTAVVLCNGYNGLGAHTFLNIFRMFPQTFDRCVFVLVGAIDAGTFKGADELDRLRESTEEQARRYSELCRRSGLEAECRTGIGHDVLSTIQELVESTIREHPSAVVFAGQLAFQRESVWTRWLHNYAVFALQRVFCRQGVPFVIVPIRV